LPWVVGQLPAARTGLGVLGTGDQGLGVAGGRVGGVQRRWLARERRAQADDYAQAWGGRAGTTPIGVERRGGASEVAVGAAECPGRHDQGLECVTDSGEASEQSVFHAHLGLTLRSAGDCEEPGVWGPWANGGGYRGIVLELLNVPKQKLAGNQTQSHRTAPHHLDFDIINNSESLSGQQFFKAMLKLCK